jgi:hypothetical protein
VLRHMVKLVVDGLTSLSDVCSAPRTEDCIFCLLSKSMMRKIWLCLETNVIKEFKGE